ncbi:MAG: hypothetical protein ABSC76_03050 [Terracidiphilus sp.]|jgi:hypothetical protein
MKSAPIASSCNVRQFVLLAVVAWLGFSFAASKLFAQSQTGFTYNGMAYASYWYDEYQDTPQGPAGTAAMAAAGVNYATVLVTQYVTGPTATTIAPSTTSSPGYPDIPTTPTDDAVVAAIANLQAQGIKVALKPHVDSFDGTWRGEFAPPSNDTPTEAAAWATAWFASYQTFILHYAAIAAENNVDTFVIGCELRELSGSAYESYWDNIIAQIRTSYPSLTLTYAANATSVDDEFTSVSFWDKLDMIGVDGYFPLTNHADPTVAQLVNAWTTAADNVNGFAPETALKNLQTAYPSLPLIFTEIGYPSAAGSNEAPYNYSPTGSYDPTEQEDCYEAFFEVFSLDTSWMKGVFWWDWSVSAPGASDTGYSPQNKPAGEITLPKWYGASAPNFRITPVSSSLTLVAGFNSSDTIVVTELGGMTGGVTLTASGLPSGVNASFGTNPATGASVMTLTASSTATTGAATVTINGVSGSLTGSAPIALTVNPAPGFTLTASTPALTVYPGSSAGDNITIADVGGFAGAPNLTATGLPTGVTAAFVPNPATSTSTLTLTASSTAPLGGPFTVTVTGTSPECPAVICPLVTASTTIAVTVNVPQSFTLSASPASLTIVQGGSGNSTVTAMLMGGLTGPVTLAASGLPAGVTANSCTTQSVSPAPPGIDIGVSCQLTFTASGTSTVGGPVTVTIIGVANPGGPITCGIPCELMASTTIALTVNAPQSFTLAPSAPTLAVTQGSSATDTITLTDVGGFAGAVTLATTGLPVGVTAAFGTNPATGSSVLTLTASGTATTGGPVTVTISGSSISTCGLPCTLTASTTIALTVIAAPIPGFTLAASPTSLNVTQGNSGTSTITVTPSDGFTGNVTLTAAITAGPNGIDPPTWSIVTSPVSITGASAGTATINLSTTAPIAGGGCTASSTHSKMPWYASGGAALACLLLFGIPARRWRWQRRLGVMALLLAITGGVAACGGSNRKVCSAAIPASGTTIGAYTITVTASSGTATPATTTVTLNVQ